MPKTSAISKPWDNLELSEEEINQALNIVREQKYNRLEKERIDKERSAARTEAMKPWEPKEMFLQAELRAVHFFGFSANGGEDGKPVLEIDDSVKEVMQFLSYYFTNNPKFETKNNWSLKKGICLMGNVGRGKSLLMHLFARNKTQCYNVVSCREIAAGYAMNGGEIVELYSKPTPDGGDHRTFYQRQRGVCFDDLGTESEKKNYGNEMNVMSEIILNRYDKKYEMPFNMTHVTTNLSAEEIEQMYGTRVRSRFREMFNAIKLEGIDRRK